MQIFKLFGSIMVDTDKANESIGKTEKKAEGLAGTIGKGAEKIGAFGKILGGVALAGGAALGGLAIKGAHSADELKGAMNKLVSATGATTEETKALEQSMKNIYANNFGENFDDIAGAMGTLKTNTGLVGKELEKATENAFLLQDSFGFGVEETSVAVSTMMSQFGISAEKAYEMIAVGAQNGANKNGDLLDVINEYSVQFAGLGMNSGVFMESLIEGAENGVYSIDKIGDAVKEFNIRSKDMSKTSAAAYEDMGFNADDMFKRFAAGGDTAATAMQEVTKTLNDIEDPLKKNELGVALFGTQFEDIGPDIIGVLGGLDGKLASTGEYIDGMTGTLDKMNEVRYDTVGEAVSALGRKFEVGLLDAIQPIMPKLMEFVGWVSDHMPQIMAVMVTVFGKVGEVVTAAIDIFNAYVMPVLRSVYDWVIANMPMIKETFNNVFEVIKTVVQVAVDIFRDNLIPIFKVVWELVQVAFPIIMTIIKGAFEVITPIVKALWTVFDTFILPIFKKVLGWVQDNMPAIQKVFETVFTIIKNYIQFVIDVYTVFFEVLGKVFNFVKDVFSGIGTLIMKAFDGVTKFIDGIIDKFNLVKNAVKGAIDGVKKFFGIEVDDKEPKTNPKSGKSLTGTQYKPGLYSGGEVSVGGTVKVGEMGPELLDLPEGARVRPLEKNNAQAVNINVNGATYVNDKAIGDLMDLMVEYLRGKGVETV